MGTCLLEIVNLTIVLMMSLCSGNYKSLSTFFLLPGLLFGGSAFFGCSRAYRVDRSPTPILTHDSLEQSKKTHDKSRGVSGWPAWNLEEKRVTGSDHAVDMQSVSLDEMEQAIETFQDMRSRAGPTMDTAWPTLLETLDSYLNQAPERLSLSPLIRARVALEYELDRERRRGTGVLSELQKVVGKMLFRIDAKMHAVRTMATRAMTSSQGSDGRLAWPLRRGVITSGFGSRRDPIVHSKVRFHAGIDLSAGVNEPIYAAAPGLVEYAGWAGNAGRTVKLKHAGGVETIYAHLSMIMVANGQRVKEGDVIGLLGSSGRTTGPHLHFAVKIKGKPVDPLEHLKDVPLSFSQDMAGIVFGWGNAR